MSTSSSESEEDAVSRELAELIGSHYRPKGADARVTFANLQVWVRRLELEEALASLSVVHVAGTKGKARRTGYSWLVDSRVRRLLIPWRFSCGAI